MSNLNNQENEPDYQIINDTIVYNINKFNVNKHLTYNVLTKELIQKQRRLYQYRSVIKLKEDFDEEYNPFTINILCKPIKISKDMHIFEFNGRNKDFFQDKYDPKRFVIQFLTNKQNCISKLYRQLDDYFNNDDFQFNYLKEFGYNKTTIDKFDISYYQLYTKHNDDDEYDKYKNDKYKLKFGINRDDKIITTKIIIKDNKTNRMKEYKNLKFEDFDKIEKIFALKNITIQPLINLYHIYCNKPIKYGRIQRISYGILIKMKELTVYTDKFDDIIINIFKDNIKDVQYYENYNFINDIKKEIAKNVEEKINEIKIKETTDKLDDKLEDKLEDKQLIKTSNISSNILNICIFIIVLLLNNLLLFYYFKKL